LETARRHSGRDLLGRTTDGRLAAMPSTSKRKVVPSS
jgi:hypothetical protein